MGHLKSFYLIARRKVLWNRSLLSSHFSKLSLLTLWRRVLVIDHGWLGSLFRSIGWPVVITDGVQLCMIAGWLQLICPALPCLGPTQSMMSSRRSSSRHGAVWLKEEDARNIIIIILCQSRASLTSVGRKNINLFGQSSAIKIATTSEQSPSICQFFPAAIR